MADASDIETTLVGLVAQALYPDGTAAPSVVGGPAKVFRGWPDPSNLALDLKAGVACVSITPMDAERNATRYPAEWQALPTPPVTLTASVVGTSITFGGTVRVPLNVAVTRGGTSVVYPLQATDTPSGVATALAALVGGSSAGPVLTVPGATRLSVRVGGCGTLVQELKRQQKSFRLTLWCADPLTRDAVAAAIDPALAARPFLLLADGTQGRLRYANSYSEDLSQKSGLYRRDLIYSVEYATTRTQSSTTIIADPVSVTPTLNLS